MTGAGLVLCGLGVALIHQRPHRLAGYLLNITGSLCILAAAARGLGWLP